MRTRWAVCAVVTLLLLFVDVSAGGLLDFSDGGAGAVPLLCLNGGVLLRIPDPASAGRVNMQCACADGWSGESCEYRDYCAMSNPCQNGGRCFNTRTGALCHCPDEFAGGTCAQRSPCAGDPCSGHGTCLLREVHRKVGPNGEVMVSGGEGGSGSGEGSSGSAVSGAAASASPATPTPTVLPERHPRTAVYTKRKAKNPLKTQDRAVEDSNYNATGIVHYLGAVVAGHCKCEPGWTGRDCSQRHQEVCENIEPCTVFNSNDNEEGHKLCGCESAIRLHRCNWCLEQGVAFAPELPSKRASSCLAPLGLNDVAQCPPAAAQAIHSCSVMDGTPFGWCVVQAGPLGYAIDGNPTAPTAGSRGCRHWIWNSGGCKNEWGTREDALALPAPPTPTLEQCLAIPPCSDAETAGSSLCGCQAAQSLGCHWCLEQQMAYPPNHPSALSCRAVAKGVTQCPSQQAQTIHQCVGVGGTPYGWCSIDEAEPSMGYSIDGTAKSPVSNPHQCLHWFFFSNACPEKVSTAEVHKGDEGRASSADFFLVDRMARITMLLDADAVAASQAEEEEAGSIVTNLNEKGEGEGEGEGGGDGDVSPAAPMSNKDARRLISPPSHVSHLIRNYMLLWMALIALALVLRWLPHYMEQNEYHIIRDKASAPTEGRA